MPRYRMLLRKLQSVFSILNINVSVPVTVAGVTDHSETWWRNDHLLCQGFSGSGIRPRQSGDGFSLIHDMGALVGRLKGWSCHSLDSGSFTHLAVDSSCWLRSQQRLTARTTTWDVFYHMSFSKYGNCAPGLSTLREREPGRAISFLRLSLQSDVALLPANSGLKQLQAHLKALSLNHWTAREFSTLVFSDKFFAIRQDKMFQYHLVHYLPHTWNLTFSKGVGFFSVGEDICCLL